MKNGEWELEISQRDEGGRGKGCSLHAHIRGHPDVASSRKSDSVREKGNQGDIVSQTLLKGGQGVHNHELSQMVPKGHAILRSYIGHCKITQISCLL